MSADSQLTFADCAELVSAKVHPKNVAQDTPYIGLEHIVENGLFLNGMGSASDVDSQKSVFKKGDILFGKLRPYFRKVVIAPCDGICSTDIWVVRPKGNTDRNFLFYWMASQQFVDGTTRASEGTKMPRAKWDFTAKFKKPECGNEKELGLMLRNLDEKITLNRQINQTLESMAQAIFKSWFVDFDPVKAKIAAIEAGEDSDGVTRTAMRAISGKTDDELDKMEGGQPEEYAQLKTTAELFPAAMQDSELGEVPEGWTPSSVGAEFNTTMGQSPPGDTYNENGDGEPFFQGRRDFGWRYPENRVYCTKPKRMAKKGDTLLSVRAPVGDINKAVSDCCIGRGIAALLHKSGCEAYTYYSMMDLSRNFKSFDSEGTVFGSINQKDLKALKVIKPSNSLVEVFTHAAGTLDQQILNFDYQIRVLSQLRDTILPKLMSGKIRVTNIR